MNVYFDDAKSTLLRFADQLLREISAIQELEQSVKVSPKTATEHTGEAKRIRVRICESDTQEALQHLHDEFAALALKVMFYRMAVKLHYKDAVERNEGVPRLKAVE
jgi:hypothetical protein